MTEFVRCDRCGASVEGSSSYDIDGWGRFFWSGSKYLDVCPSCTAEIRKLGGWEDDKWLRRSVPECPYTEPCH